MLREVLDYYMPKVEQSDVLNRMELQPRRYFLVSAHREENVDSKENLSDLLQTLNALAEKYDIPVIVSTHPRTQKRMDALGGPAPHAKVQFLKPFGFFDYIRLQMDALCVVSDSGTIFEEASLLNLCAITIRNAHERPEGMDAGTLVMTGLKKERVLDAISVVINQFENAKSAAYLVEDYEEKNVSKKILRIVLSYTDYINRTVWHKSDQS